MKLGAVPLISFRVTYGSGGKLEADCLGHGVFCRELADGDSRLLTCCLD